MKIFELWPEESVTMTACTDNVANTNSHAKQVATFIFHRHGLSKRTPS